MALVVGTNTYATLEDIQVHLSARGYTLTVTEASVLRAMDYIEALPWVPSTEEITTPLRWGEEPPSGVVTALCEAVRIELTTPNALSPASEQKLKSLSVGPVALTFGNGEGRTSFPSILRSLQGLLSSPNIITRVLV